MLGTGFVAREMNCIVTFLGWGSGSRSETCGEVARFLDVRLVAGFRGVVAGGVESGVERVPADVVVKKGCVV